MYGIDLSHHQVSSKLPWSTWNGQVDLVMVRACYGAELRDRQALEHVKNARAIGARVGLYAFFRPSQPAAKQFDVFLSVLEACSIREGDVVPALDIETDPLPQNQAVAKSWAGAVSEITQHLDAWCGSKSMPYITQADFDLLGRPPWILEADRPLWVAHYTSRPAPATPANRPWTIWQHRVAAFQHDGPGGYDKAQPLLDQNRINGPLPLIGATPPLATIAPDSAPQDPTQNDADWDELRDRGTLLQFPHWDLIEQAERHGRTV
jgi:hypothetical protein